MNQKLEGGMNVIFDYDTGSIKPRTGIEAGLLGIESASYKDWKTTPSSSVLTMDILRDAARLLHSPPQDEEAMRWITAQYQKQIDDMYQRIAEQQIILGQAVIKIEDCSVDTSKLEPMSVTYTSPMPGNYEITGYLNDVGQWIHVTNHENDVLPE